MNYHKRLKLLQKYIGKCNLDAFLITFKVDILYMTGMNISEGKLLVTKEDASLFVDYRYFEKCKKKSYIQTLLQEEFAIGNYIEQCFTKQKINIGFDSRQTSYYSYCRLDDLVKCIDNVKRKKIIEFVAFDSPLKALRSIKDEEEIGLMKKAANLAFSGFDYVCSMLKEGIIEKEIAQELEIFWKRNKGDKVSFDPIIAFGANSSMPHYSSGDIELQNDQIVLVDIGVFVNHYASDMTRMVFFGNIDEELKNITKIVQRANHIAFECCRPGMTFGELDNLVRTFITEQGYGKEFKHALGHGLGLEVHEYPCVNQSIDNKDVIIQENMIFTIEPGIYLENKGGARIEDTVLVKSYGCEKLIKRSTDPVVIIPSDRRRK